MKDIARSPLGPRAWSVNVALPDAMWMDPVFLFWVDVASWMLYLRVPIVRGRFVAAAFAATRPRTIQVVAAIQSSCYVRRRRAYRTFQPLKKPGAAIVCPDSSRRM